MKHLILAAALALSPLAFSTGAEAQGAAIGAMRGAAEGDRVGGPVGAAMGSTIGGIVGGSAVVLGQPDPGPAAYRTGLPTRAGYVPPQPWVRLHHPRRHHAHRMARRHR